MRTWTEETRQKCQGRKFVFPLQKMYRLLAVTTQPTLHTRMMCGRSRPMQELGTVVPWGRGVEKGGTCLLALQCAPGL